MIYSIIQISIKITYFGSLYIFKHFFKSDDDNDDVDDASNEDVDVEIGMF